MKQWCALYVFLYSYPLDNRFGFSISVQPEITPLLIFFFNVKNLFFKRMQVCDKLAKWLIMLGFMDLRWPRVARRSNAALLLFYLGRKMFTQCSKMFSFQVKSNIQNNILTLHMHAWLKGYDDRQMDKNNPGMRFKQKWWMKWTNSTKCCLPPSSYTQGPLGDLNESLNMWS